MERFSTPTIVYNGDARWIKGEDHIITETQVRHIGLWDNKCIAVPACRLRIWNFFKRYGPSNQVSLMSLPSGKLLTSVGSGRWLRSTTLVPHWNVTHGYRKATTTCKQPYFHQCIKLTSSSVIAHYDEDVNMMRESIESVLQRLPSSKSHRVIIYSKGDRNKAGLRELLEISDEVVAIPNVGREGETYLVSLLFFFSCACFDLERRSHM